MRFRLLSAITGLAILIAVLPAAAQFSAPASGGGGFGAPGGGGFGAPGPGGGGGAFGAPGGIDCQGTVNSLMSEREKAGKNLQAANKRKADLQTACGLIKNYVSVEDKLLKFLRTNKAACGVPEQFLKQLADAHGKASQMGTKVCEAAAGGGAAAQRPPSAGLSNALGLSDVGRGSPDAPPSGLFDTLNGNVLTR
jgi:hypothetical protein